jgi:hypothetical protein
MKIDTKLNKATAVIVPGVTILLYTLGLAILPKSDTVITCYVFGLLSAVLFGIGNLYFVSSKSGYPWVAAIPLTIGRYVVTSALISILFALASTFIPVYKLPVVVPIIAHIIALAFYLVMLLLLHTGKQYIEQVDNQIAKSTSFIREMTIEIAALSRNAPPEVSKELKALADTVRYGDPKSNPNAIPLERDIQANTERLRTAITNRETDVIRQICTDTIRLLKERADMLRSQKSRES